MKLQDKETLNVAAAVRDVLEGKRPAELNEAVAVTEMDPKKHVKKKDGKFCVYNTKGDIVKEFDDEAAAVKYATDNHDDLMSESPDEPTSKGEKEFKAKHVVKKSGMNTDGSNVKEEVEELEEGLSASDMKKAMSIINDPKTKGGNYSQALKDLEKWKKGSTKDPKVADALKAAHESKEEVEESMEEASKEDKYKAFFMKALKKFGVKSPAELDGEKKKEFFDYVDKNYEADNEEDAEEEVVETTITVSAANINKLTSMSEKKVTVDIDWIGDAKQTKDTEKKFKLKIKADARQGTADVTGDNKQIVKMLTDPDVYGWDKADVLDVWPELK
jgi:hypothetical protein